MLSGVIAWAERDGLVALGIIIGAWILSKLLKRFIARIIRRAIPRGSFSSEMAERKREDTLINITQGFLGVFIWVAAFLAVLDLLGVPIGPLLAGAGIVGVAVGFGSQSLVKDVINGLFIIAENQFRIGDVIEVAGKSGVVEGMTLHVTKIREMNGTINYVPNGEIKVSSNSSKDFSVVDLVIGVSYDANLDHVKDTVNEVGKELAEDPDYRDRVIEPPYFLRVHNLGASSVDIRILGRVLPKEQFAVAGELRKRIKERFEKEGIGIPYPTRTVINTNR